MEKAERVRMAASTVFFLQRMARLVVSFGGFAQFFLRPSETSRWQFLERHLVNQKHAQVRYTQQTLVTGKRTTHEFLMHTLEPLVKNVPEDKRTEWYLTLRLLSKRTDVRGKMDGLVSRNL